jgi:nitrate reductase beta subunit
MPTICSETCVGRIRYIGVVLYDADRVEEAASVADEKDLLDAQLSVFLDPDDPEVRRQAERDGIPADWIDAARRSPVYALAMRYRVALPLHPEYRTLPMVWYVPPLSPVMGVIEGEGSPADPDDVFPAIDRLRIPIRYLSNLLAAGDDEVVRTVLKQLAAMRRYMRERNLAGKADASIAESVGMSVGDMDDMYRLLALAKYDERFVIPSAHAEFAGDLAIQQGACGLDFAGGPGSCGADHVHEHATAGANAMSVEDFHLPATTAPVPPGPATQPSPAADGGAGGGCGGGSCTCGGATPSPGVA